MADRASGDRPVDATDGAIEGLQECSATDPGAVEDEQPLADTELGPIDANRRSGATGAVLAASGGTR